MKDGKKQQEESFSFIQETVVPKKRSKVKKAVTSIVSTLLLALLFGGVASLVICFCVPSFAKWAGIEVQPDGKKPISFSEDTVPTPSPTTALNPTPSSLSENAGKTDTPVVLPEPGKIENPGEKKGKRQTLTIKDYEMLFSNLREVEKQMKPALVKISNVRQQVDMFNTASETEDTFYGLYIADNGEDLLFLTSARRILKAKELVINLNSGVALKASIYGRDEETGIAILSLPLERVPKEVYENLEVAELGNSYGIRMGEPVLAVGSPNGYVFSMEAGMVMNDAYERYITDFRLDLFNTDMHTYSMGEGVIIDLQGRVVGVITHDFQDDKNKDSCVVMGISRLKPIIERLVNQKKRVYFGALEADIANETLKGIGLENGIYITEVLADSPALNAGIQNGDILISINGKNIASVAAFSNILEECRNEESIRVKLLRTSKAKMPEMEVEVELEKR